MQADVTRISDIFIFKNIAISRPPHAVRPEWAFEPTKLPFRGTSRRSPPAKRGLAGSVDSGVYPIQDSLCICEYEIALVKFHPEAVVFLPHF
jgi:hypothetical protein